MEQALSEVKYHCVTLWIHTELMCAGVQGHQDREDPDPDQLGHGRARAVLPPPAQGHQGLPGHPDGRHRGHGRGRHDGHPGVAGPRRARAQHQPRLSADGGVR